MAVKILMPALSPTMVEGTLAKWVKKEGERIEPGEIIAEIETDKATMEVDAVDSGILVKILIPESTSGVKVNELIAVIKEDGDSEEDVLNALQDKGSSAKDMPDNNAGAPGSEIGRAEPKAEQELTIKAGRIKASPLAKKMATQNNVALSDIGQGSGPYNRIIKNDVLSFIDKQNNNVNKPEEYVQTQAQQQSSQSLDLRSASEPSTSIIEPSNMRKVIARRLLQSKRDIPHFYISSECEVSEMLEVRKNLNDLAKTQGEEKEYRLSVNDIIIKASGMALNSVKEMNSYWENDKIVQLNSIDISIAIAVNGGIFTPVIRDVNHKTISAISKEVKSLVAKAKEGKLSPKEMEGGSMSISNLGMYDVDQFNAIINPPQSSILAVGSIKQKPVVLPDASIGIGNIMTATLSCDHRIVDGAIAANFLSIFKKYLANPITMIV